MCPFEYVVIYAIICITGSAAKPPYGDNRSADYKYYDAVGSGQEAEVPRNTPSYPYNRAPAASDNYRRYRDEYRPREKNPYRRYHQHDGRPDDHNEYNRYDNDYPASTPPPATPPSPTPKPAPQQNNINADTLTVKEIRLGPWKIYNNVDGDGNHLVIVDTTGDNDNHIIVDSDGTLHVNELTIDTDWTLRQEGSNMVIRDNTGGNNRLALARGLGTCWTLDGTCRLVLNALTVVKNWIMTEDQGSLIVKNVNNANDRLKLSPGMGPWTLDSSRTMDLNTINVGPEKKWAIRQEESPGALMIRDMSGAVGSDNRAAFYPGLGTCFTFDDSCQLALTALNLSSSDAPGSLISQGQSSSGDFYVDYVLTIDVELEPTTTRMMTVDASGEMLIKGMKVGTAPNLWGISVADTTNALVLKALTPLSNDNNQAVFMPDLSDTCWTFDSTCSLTLNTLTAQTALFLGLSQWKMYVDGNTLNIKDLITTSGDHRATFAPGLGTCWNFDSSCSLALKKLTIGNSGQWVFQEETSSSITALVLRYPGSTSNRMAWFPNLGEVTWDSAPSLTLNQLFLNRLLIGPNSPWVMQLEAPYLVIRDRSGTVTPYDHRMALKQGMNSQTFN